MAPERVVGLGFVALLHVAAISAIVFGLRQHYAMQTPPPPIIVDTTHVKTPPQPHPPLPPVDMSNATRLEVQPPVFRIRDDQPQTPLDPQPPQPQREQVASIPDTATTGIMSTHSSPPFPLLERRLGHQGTVTLKLTIAPDGTVTGAEVVKSSGYRGLDEAAVSWVTAHWRYNPATHAGSAIPSQATAAVMFSLRTAG